MKKTVIVNINGIIFHIDEDAYEKLNTYIDALHRYFDLQTEGKEIVSDIESRIAELLQPRINESKQSITKDDIEEIIVTLGKPEDIADSSSETEPSAPEMNAQPKTNVFKQKKLFRDPDHALVGGVLSGIGAYFSADPVIFRVLYLLLLGSVIFMPTWYHPHGFITFLLIITYIILWIVIPKAETAAQKLEMRGEEVNINNIERTYHHPGQTGSNNIWGRIRNVISTIFDVFGKIFFVFWRIFVFVFGVFLVFLSLTFIVGLIAAAFANNFVLHELTGNIAISVQDYFSPIISPMSATILLIVILLIAIIPLVGLMYAGLKLLVRFKANDKWAILSLFILWIFVIILASILIFNLVNYFKFEDSANKVIPLKMPEKNIIYLKISNPFDDDHNISYNLANSNLYGISVKDNKKELYGVISMDIEKSSSALPELEIICKARGISDEKAMDAARQIKVNFTQTDSVLSIDPRFWLSQNQSWKFQHTRVILHLPEGMKIYLDENTRHFLDNIHFVNDNDYWEDKMIGRTLLMTDDGLRFDYIANSNPFFQKTIVVKVNPIKNVHKIDSLFSKRRRNEVVINTDSGKYFFGQPILSFKAWDKDYLTCRPLFNYYSGFRRTIHFDYQFGDSTLSVDPIWYSHNVQIKNGRLQPLFIKFQIPEGTQIYFSSEVGKLLSADQRYLVGHTWRITNKGFKEIEKK